MALLLAGGSRDPSLAALARAARENGIPVVDGLAAPGNVPAISCDAGAGGLRLHGRVIREEGERPCVSPNTATPGPEVPVSAAFLRGDVFATHPGNGAAPAGTTGQEARAQAKRDNRRTNGDHAAQVEGYLAVLRGWLAGADRVRCFNRDPFGRSRSVNKLAALRAAALLGLAVPETLSGNDGDALMRALAGGPLVQKPFRGGNYCRPLTAGMLETHLAGGRALPAVTAQARLVAPDLRVFRVGTRLVGFEIRSGALDYRTDPAARIVPRDIPGEIAAPLVALNDAMGLDWCASDFKTCPETGAFVYLETNANPMFHGFDRASDGALCRAMLAALGFVVSATEEDSPYRDAPDRRAGAARPSEQRSQASEQHGKLHEPGFQP